MPNNLTVFRGTASYSSTAKAGTAAKASGWLAQIPAAATPFLSSSAIGVGTIEGWVNAGATGLMMFASMDNVFWVGAAGDGTMLIHYGNSATELALSSTTSIATGAYVHVAVVFNFVSGVGSLSLYANGNRVATTSAYSAPGTSSTMTSPVIGGLNAGYPQYDWPGQIDDFVVTTAAKYTGATYTIPAAPAATSATNQTAYYAFDSSLTDSNIVASVPTISAPSVSGLAVGGSSTISGTFSNGAPTGLSQVLDGTTTAVSSPTITTTSGASGTAAGTYSYTITTPAAAAHSIQVNGTGTYAATGSATAFTTTATGLTVDVAPNNAGIYYSPVVWGVTAGSAKTINAGAYLRTLLSGLGGSLVLNFDMTGLVAPLPQVSITIDGVISVATVAATITVTVPTVTVWTKHLLEIEVKATTETQSRWSPQATAVVFLGITATGATASLPITSSLNGAAIGDSITEGVRALGSTQTFDTDRNDARQGWALLQRRLMGAEIGIIGFGAQGVTQGGSGGVPAVGTAIASLWSSGPTRSFAGLDFVIINQGTNDSGDITTGYTALLNTLLAGFSGLVFAMLPFNGRHASEIQAARLACSNAQRIIYVDTTGWFATADSSDGTHPYGYANATVIAPRLASVIRGALRGVPNRWTH